MSYRYIDVTLSPSQKQCKILPLYQWDHGIVLRIYGLPASVSIYGHFAYDGQKSAFAVSGTSYVDHTQIVIPDVMLFQEKSVTCYVYCDTGDSSYTYASIYIPVIKRAKPVDLNMNPQQYETFNELVNAVNSLLNNADSIFEKSDNKVSSVSESTANGLTYPSTSALVSYALSLLEVTQTDDTYVALSYRRL